MKCPMAGSCLFTGAGNGTGPGEGATLMNERVKSPRTLTGRWTGYYVQRDKRRDLTADLTQTGEKLRGTMQDLETVFEMSVFEMALEGGLPPGADEMIVSRIRKQFPELPGDPIRASMSLPSHSSVEGQVRSRTVYFLKSYQGEAFSGYRIGQQRIGMTIAGHAVHYRGQLSADGSTLEGTWWMSAQPALGIQRAEGAFLLERDE